MILSRAQNDFSRELSDSDDRNLSPANSRTELYTNLKNITF